MLREISFEVRRGDVLGVIGRNGVGKTTLLRLMAGILSPTDGLITRPPGISCSLLSLGLGFQPQLNGRDNALLSAMLQGATVGQAEALLSNIAEFSELGRSFDEPVKTYSAGMRARLGFATAIVTHVDILLIDEVLSVGDADFRKKARIAMQDKIAGDQTVVLVSHSERQVRSLCDRAIVLESGHLVYEGAIDESLSYYDHSVRP